MTLGHACELMSLLEEEQEVEAYLHTQADTSQSAPCTMRALPKL